MHHKEIPAQEIFLPTLDQLLKKENSVIAYLPIESKYMLKSISWHELLSLLIPVVVMYYLSVISFFYNKELSQILKVRKRRKEVFDDDRENYPNETHDLFSVANNLSEVIRRKIKEAADSNMIREELLLSIQNLLLNYSILKNTPFQIAINNLIEHNCKNDCSIHLSEDDMRVVWMR